MAAMITQEMMHSTMQERLREAAELRRQRQAQRSREATAAPRGGRSPKSVRKFSLISFLVRIRTASAH